MRELMIYLPHRFPNAVALQMGRVAKEALLSTYGTVNVRLRPHREPYLGYALREDWPVEDVAYVDQLVTDLMNYDLDRLMNDPAERTAQRLIPVWMHLPAQFPYQTPERRMDARKEGWGDTDGDEGWVGDTLT